MQEIASQLKDHPLFNSEDIEKLGKGATSEQIEKKLKDDHALPLYIQGDRLVGCLQKALEDDASLVPEVLVENLAARASGALALRHLIAKTGQAQEIDYLLGFW